MYNNTNCVCFLTDQCPGRIIGIISKIPNSLHNLLFCSFTYHVCPIYDSRYRRQRNTGCLCNIFDRDSISHLFNSFRLYNTQILDSLYSIFPFFSIFEQENPLSVIPDTESAEISKYKSQSPVTASVFLQCFLVNFHPQSRSLRN